jgi:hypothetical protein
VDKPSLPSFLKRRASPDISGFIQECRDLQVHILTWFPTGCHPKDRNRKPWEVPTDPSLYYGHQRYLGQPQLPLVWDNTDKEWKRPSDFGMPMLQWTYDCGANGQWYATSKHPPEGVMAGTEHQHVFLSLTPVPPHFWDGPGPIDAEKLSALLWEYKKPPPQHWTPYEPDGEPWEVPIDPSLYYGSTFCFIPPLRWIQHVGDDGQPYTTSEHPPEGFSPRFMRSNSFSHNSGYLDVLDLAGRLWDEANSAPSERLQISSDRHR